MRIDRERLRVMIEELGEIGADPEGGISRIAYTPVWEDGILYVEKRMEEAGMQTRRDAIGNLFGIYPGRTDQILLTGSHIDTVPHGGMFDGALGVLAAVEAVHTLRESDIQPEHTILTAVWAEEEGNRVFTGIGSGAFCGQIPEMSELNLEKLHQAGHSMQNVRDSVFDGLDRIDASLELHIEQGAVLEKAGVQIGIVEGIFGLHRYETTVFGTADHAGTTPMDMRDDAMVKAARLICELEELTKKTDPRMVCTTGWLRAEPGMNNIIAEKVTMMVECRGMNEEALRTVRDYIASRYGEGGTYIEDTLILPPVPMSQACREAVRDAASELGFTSMPVFSGAGHDSECLAHAIPDTGMIFVRSRGGKSHCPQEWTDWEDCAAGADVLLHALMKLDIQARGQADKT